MGIYDGRSLAQEHLLNVAKHCAQAAFKAPQITGRLKLQIVALTHEKEMLPIIEAFDILGKFQPGHVKNAWGYRKLFESGETVVMVLLGADLTVSDLGWDCGACGFRTCKEFNAYSKKHRGVGHLNEGPTCNWKALDFGTACGWAAAAAAQDNADNRISMFEGAIARALGYLEGCSYVLSIPLVSGRDLWFYSRPAINRETFSYDWWKDYVRTFIPTSFMPFFSPTTIPWVKTRQDWEQEMASPKYTIPKEDQEIVRKRDDVRKRLREFVEKKKPEVAKMKKELTKLPSSSSQ
jgi:uncharacterized ferredoxin-like protein